MEDKPRKKTRTSPAAVKKWQAAHIKRYCLPVSIDSEREIVEKLDSVPNKAGYIKSLIRADIEKGEHKMKRISIDNGATYCTPAEALEAVTIDQLAQYMDDDTREAVHGEIAPCTDEEFLTRYLELAPADLILG